jgi:hypothetical protein
MSNSYVQNIMHITFHVGKDCRIDENDIPQLCDYIGGIINNLGGVLIAAGGIWSHIHLLVSVPKQYPSRIIWLRLKPTAADG